MHIRDFILSKTDLPSATVSIPEWGDRPFTVRSMTAAERDALDSSSRDGDKVDLSNFRARLVVRTLFDDKGQRVFTDADAAAVGKLAAGPVSKAFDAAAKLNGLTKGDIEELEKN